MAESIMLLCKHFNQAMAELEAVDGEKRIRIIEKSIDDILEEHDMIHYMSDGDDE